MPKEDPYRPVRPLPFELSQHVGIFFEEKLYSQALNLLIHILSSGTPAQTPAYIPNPPHLAAAATCLVHPRTTTRAKAPDEKDAAATALRLLRLTNTLIGPVSAKFSTAFNFTHFESSRHGASRRRSDDAANVSGSSMSEEMRPLNLDLGQSASLWSRAEDFWHVVGWAFNCSVLHPGRWEVWRLWLDFMCDVLDDDWSERLKLADEEDGSKDRPLKDSLIFKYIDGGSIAFGRNRRILRAIFADGSHASVGEFGQIFSRELDSTAPNTETESRTASASAAVDISQNQFGDYLSDDGDEDEDQEPDVDEPPRARKRPRRGTKSNPTSTSTSTTTTASSLHLHLGGPNSLSLRQRLLSLLSCVSNRLPNSFLPLDDLYHLFIENIRHLPFPTFHRFVSPSLSLLTEPQQTTLCDYILFRMLEASAPGTDSLDSDDPCNMTQEKLEECFLSFAANTAAVADNAKVSVTLEALVVLLARDGLIVVTEGLREAVTRGIVARVEKAGAAGGDEKRKVAGRGRGRGMGMGELEQCWLLESADRLMFLVDEVLPRNERT